MKRNEYISAPLCLLANMIMAYLAYLICRLAFLVENWSMFSANITWSSFGEMLKGGWMFDTSAILYTNALYALMMLLPLHLKENWRWQFAAKCVFIVVNAISIAANLADCVYFQYTGRRTTATVFSEFDNESNLGSIVGIEFLRHWYLVVLFVIMIWGMWRFYVSSNPKRIRSYITYYIVQVVCLGIYVPLSICGMRGGATTAVRPITISNANQYVDRPLEAGIVLNTPFSIIRTIGKKVFVTPNYFTPEELDKIYSPIHTSKSLPSTIYPLPSKNPSNIVILIVESFGREYIGGYNKWLDGGKYKGYTPFVDSLMQHSTTFLYSYCNGRKSIDGMPSILSGIPMFVEPFFLTPASMNDVSSIAGELKSKGYYSAFFHGAENGSMGFQAYARTSGFDDYFGRTEYNADKRFNGDDDYDGMWAIWDEPFLQFFATKMSEFKQPFMSAVFTASSHHPYKVPQQYEKTYPEEGIVIHKCIRYTDNAIRLFFEKAKKQPWYDNTLFVITSDHTNLSDHEYYQTDLGGFCSPIIFFDPSGRMQPGMRNAIAQQIDIMPTVLSYLGYDKPYVAFGCDLLTTPDEETWAVNYQGGIYQYVEGDYLLQFDGNETKALYRFRTDLLLKHNVAKEEPMVTKDMERRLKAIIQSYMTRMNENKLIVRH
ncbi:MAG: sulfatase-like hydrolase/transferase [Prevotellaceae bacterium]|nr:sulfatase-like hydrolase/transferase [Prevotellaceae bacterium]